MTAKEVFNRADNVPELQRWIVEASYKKAVGYPVASNKDVQIIFNFFNQYMTDKPEKITCAYCRDNVLKATELIISYWNA